MSKKMQFNQREILAVNNPEYYTCINWKPLGDRQRFEYPNKQEAIQKGKSIIKQDNKAKIMIYAVNGSNMALVDSFKGSAWK
tara:strand:+ start:286 stop:531 length:246 start_codon:yes stop_codon:yes gene_type:complete